MRMVILCTQGNLDRGFKLKIRSLDTTSKDTCLMNNRFLEVMILSPAFLLRRGYNGFTQACVDPESLTPVSVTDGPKPRDQK